jgi:branched-chain amino acid aminotransferase
VIVTDNLFGDILTDLGGAVSGGIGSRSGQPQPGPHRPVMFEPVHGSAPDIAGQARPTRSPPSSGGADARLPRRGRRRRPHPRGLRRPDLTGPPPRSATRSPLAWQAEPPCPSTHPEDLDERRARRLGPGASVHVLTHTLHYGTGVFEGIRAYETADGPAVFRLTEHIVRLFTTAQDHRDGDPVLGRRARRGHQGPCASTGLPSCYIRPIAYYGYGEMGLNTLPCKVDVAIACWPWGAYLGDDAVDQGRADEDLVVDPPRPQHDAAGGQDHRQLREQLAGQGRGAQGRLRRGDHARPERPRRRVHRREHLRRAQRGDPHAAAVGRRARGHHPELGHAIARDLGIDVRVDNLARSDLYIAEEIFVCGTAAEVSSVNSVDDRAIPCPGPMTTADRRDLRPRLDQYQPPVGAEALAGGSRLSASPPRLPGAAEPTWLARPTRSPERSLPQPADVVAPVAWWHVADRRLARRPVARSPRSPAACVPDPGEPVPDPSAGGSSLAPVPLPPREPGWSLTSGGRCGGCPPWLPSNFEAVPRAPVGVRCPVRGTHCTLCFPWSSGIFQVTGLSRSRSSTPPCATASRWRASRPPSTTSCASPSSSTTWACTTSRAAGRAPTRRTSSSSPAP